MDDYDLTAAIGGSVGDESLCVALADTDSGRVTWTYEAFNQCVLERQTCDEAVPVRTGEDWARMAAETGEAGFGSCRDISWAYGQTGRDGVVYAALMAGERVLPGMIIQDRLERVFQQAGF